MWHACVQVGVDKVIYQVKTNCGNVYGVVIICFNQGLVSRQCFSRDEFTIYESKGKCFVFRSDNSWIVIMFYVNCVR